LAKIADLGAAVAHIVLTLLAGDDSRPSTRSAASEAADACRVLHASADPVDDRLRPCLLWWSAALESALAFGSRVGATRAHHRGRAARDMREAGEFRRTLDIMNGGDGSDPSAAVFVYAPMLALMWFPLSQISSAGPAISHCRTAIAAGRAYWPPDLLKAAQAVLDQLISEHLGPTVGDSDGAARADESFADTRLGNDARGALEGNDRERFAAVMDKAVERARNAMRPELLGAGASNTLAGLAALAAYFGQPWAADDCARLLEASSLAAHEHLAVGLPVNRLNRGATLDALIHRSLLAGELGRRSLPARDVTDPGALATIGDRCCVWLHEADKSFGTVVVARRRGTEPVAASTATLTEPSRLALRDLADGRPARMTSAVCDELGEKLLGEMVTGGWEDVRSVIVIPSQALRSLPVEALTIGGRPAVGAEATVTIAPALATWAALPPPPRLSPPFGLLGVFDEALPGARTEMESLRAMGRSGIIDGRAVLSPSKLGEQLTEHSPMVLSIAVHGTVTPAGLTLHFPGGTATGLDFLGWRLPPVVVLAACRSSSPGTIRWPIDLVSACLRSGASAVIVSRWPVADDVTARIMAGFYLLLSKGATPGAALRAAARSESANHLSSWASLAVFGRAD
jgi:CHAT domain